MTPRDYLWEALKGTIYEKNPYTFQELQDKIRRETANISGRVENYSQKM
jgi:hypothetical protein